MVAGQDGPQQLLGLHDVDGSYQSLRSFALRQQQLDCVGHNVCHQSPPGHTENIHCHLSTPPASLFWQATPPACLSTANSCSFDGYLDCISIMPPLQILFTPILSHSITLHNFQHPQNCEIEIHVYAPSSDENVMVQHVHDLHWQ